MPQINIPSRIKLLGKKKERSQIIEGYTIDGRIVTAEYPALNNVIDDGQRAFLLRGTQQYYDNDYKAWIQPVSEIDANPLRLREDGELVPEKEINKKIDDIFTLTLEQKRAEQYKLARKKDGNNFLLSLVSIVFGAFIIISAIVYLR